jgi:SAM-dependent methyltransferase
VRSDDLSAEACRRAQAIYAIDGAAVDIQRLPYRDCAFDVVLCSETLEHVADLEAATRELIRVSRRAVVITVPHESRRAVARNIRDKVVHGHIHALHPRSFDFTRPLVAAIVCEKMLSPLTRLLGLAADGVERERLGPLPAIAVAAFNRAMPLCRTVFGRDTVAAMLGGDRRLIGLLRGYGGLGFVLLKDPACRTSRPLRQVAAQAVLDFAVPLHRPLARPLTGPSARRRE